MTITPTRAVQICIGPYIQFQYTGVILEPVCKLVFRGEDLGESVISGESADINRARNLQAKKEESGDKAYDHT